MSIKGILVHATNCKIFKLLNDENYLRIRYKIFMNKKLDLKKVNTFNEKLQWLKLYYRDSKYTSMVDKYEAKKYVENIIGEKYIIPTIGIYNKFDEIDFNRLPNQFVIKCTHDSGGLVVCKDKMTLNIGKARKKIKTSMKKNYYNYGREWPYKNVKPRIIVERYMEDESTEDLKDYKLFCFGGKVEMILVCSNRTSKDKNTDFYDCNWNLMPFTRANHKNNPHGIDRPKRLEEMIEIAQKLSKGIPFVRVDLYEINGRVYFGELTFFPSGGFEGFNPPEYDKILGDLLTLPKEKRK